MFTKLFWAFALLIASLLHHPEGIAAEEDEKDTLKPLYEDVKEKTKGDSKTFYGKDGLCGWWDGKGYVKPKLNYSNAFSPEEGEQRAEPGNCLFRFHQKALRPVCGDPWYAAFKYCTMVQFYNNEVPGPLTAEKNKDLLLMLLDGCVLCKYNGGQSAKDFKVSFKLEHEWPAGTLLTACSQETHTAGTFEIGEAAPLIKDEDAENGTGRDYNKFAGVLQPDRVNVNVKDPNAAEAEAIRLSEYQTGLGASFTFSGLLYQRQCNSLFGQDPMEEKYQGVQLVVEHSCGGGGKKKLTVKLPDVKAADFQNNMAEMQGLMLLLDDGKWYQYSTTTWKHEDKDSLPGGMPVFQHLMDEKED